MEAIKNILTKAYLGLRLAWREIVRPLTRDERHEYERELRHWPWK